jgi:hypothetical protein
VIPPLIRRVLSPVRPAVDALRSWIRMRKLRAGLRELKNVTSEEQLDLALIVRIRAAWGNPGWTGDAGFLREVAARVWRCPGPVLDCGSGLSTVILASLASRHGATVWSLEQDRRWYEHMERILPALGIVNVVLWYTPLRSYGDFLWFDLGSHQLPPHFPTVSCDGPAVKNAAGSPEQVDAWRSGVLPVLQDLGVSFDEILLDDAEDPRSAGLIERWQRGGLETELVATPTGSLIVARHSKPPGRAVS